MNEESKQHWIKLGIIALVFFLVSYLAFHLAMKHNLSRFNNPYYQMEKMEKVLQRQERDLERFAEKDMESPFIPKMRPMLVNLVKEPNEYKVIVDLKPLDGDEKAINVDIQGDELTIRGELDKKIRGSEKIINFTQTYYLDEKIEEQKISREKKGDKYIVTIPFVSENNND